ncbi:MAG: hypothetical protein ACK4MQ_05110 [Hyphomonas sp.]
MSQFSYYFEIPDVGDLSARALVLSLMSSIGTQQQTIASLINAGELFGIEASTVRVAVTRLLKDGLLESPQRGVYVPGPRARALTRRVQQWQGVAGRVAPWDGGWLAAMTHYLGRRDRRQMRGRERALALYGYREADAGLWVRPANLARPLADHRRDLIGIGADEAIILLRLADIAADAPPGWPALWSAADLEASYGRAIAAMEDSLRRLPRLSLAEAARETLLIGQAVIRAINFDPLLPPELGNQALFLKMVESMRVYNEAGVACWRAHHAARGS